MGLRFGGQARWSVVVVVLAVVCMALVLAPAALAAGRVYWGNVSGSNPISFANLDGSGGGNLTTTGATPEAPWGVTIDAAAGKIYWVNNDNDIGQTDGVSFANLDGSGGGTLSTPGVTGANPEGVAVDPAAGKIYWANPTTEKIAYANLNGSGGGTLNTGSATVDTPDGVAIDPADGKIYWTNEQSSTTAVSFASLDGSGGGDLETTGATVSEPEGVAIDASTGKIYWANNGSNTAPISFANLDDSGGGGNLTVTGATPDEAFGVAIDPAAGKIYWVNEGSNTVPVSFANLDGSGGGNLTTTGATPSIPGWPSLLEPPSGTGAPVISGGSAASSTLTCSEGAWAPDLVESFLYRAPHSFAYSWSLNGTPISGADSSTITASSVGSYACQVTATNHAGSTTQASAAHTVSSPGPGRLTISGEKATSNGVDVTIACAGAATQSCSGDVTVTTTETLHRSTVIAVTATAKHHKRVVTVARRSYRLAGGKSIELKLKLNRKGKALLKRFGKLPVIVKTTHANSNGQKVTISHRKLTIKTKKHKHH
jgi:DNA-binding beta-propeller fold protein YncE